MKTKRLFTPENIQTLSENQIFVFGSNKAGNHLGGAAKYALDHFNAKMGISEGRTGQCYAIPTLDENFCKLPLDEIEKSLQKFARYTIENLHLTFLVTKIGCGIAKFSEVEISNLFKKTKFLENVILPKEFCITKGYKVFNFDWTCRCFKYKVGELYTIDDYPIICKNGFHFCEKLVDCYNYYDYNKNNKIAEVEILGLTDTDDGKKYCTNSIKITKEIKWEEVDSLVNLGLQNSGRGNSGDYNSGDYNSGYHNSGVFCTRKRTDPVIIFNKESQMTWDEWYDHPAYRVSFNLRMTEWVCWSDMTDKEKEENKTAYVCDGYLKTYSYKEAWSNLWEILDQNQRNSFKTLPNFDSKIFEEITGIKID